MNEILGQYGESMKGEKTKYTYREDDDNDLIVYNVYDDPNGEIDASDIYITSMTFDKIKLADGTNTTFNPSNPDVRYERGGKSKTFNMNNQYDDGGEVYQDIKCIGIGCDWEWNTKDSDESDKYICHHCGFDNRTFYDADPIG